MKTNTISRIFSYYLNNDEFNLEVEKAKNEFFDVERGNYLITVDTKLMPYFMEYLVFDFRLENGQSLIEHYYTNNPDKLPLYKLRVYKDLQKNVYGALEAKKINLGKSIDVLVLNTGKRYLVKERNATYELKVGNIFFGRVAKIDGVYELVGADSFAFDVKLSNNIKKLFKTKEKLTPKVAIRYLKEPKQELDVNDSFINISREKQNIYQIKKDFNNMLKEVNEDKMINADLVQRWLIEINFKEDYHSVLNTVYALSDMDLIDDSKANKLIKLTTDLVNNSPRLSLDGKTSVGLSSGESFGSEGFDLRLNKLGGEWLGQANTAMECLKKNEVNKAHKTYDKAFKTAHKEKTTSRFVYTSFANMAVCYIHFGSEYMARKLLETALEIKFNYVFAKKLLKEIDDKKHDAYMAKQIRQIIKNSPSEEIYMFKFKKLSKNYSDAKLCREYYKLTEPLFKVLWRNSYSKKYYNFLKKLNINYNDVQN